jgi:5-methylcytosine-specific restriction protein B
VTDLTTVRDEIEALLDADEPIVKPITVTLPPATDELAAEVHMPKDWLDEYIDLLGARHQLIVYGPPGTGKTYVARKVARHVAGEDRVSVVQFHPSYAYEDFFEGLRPVTTEGTVGYELSPGPLRRIASAAAEDPGNPYVLIIDEINRADIAKVFGELYYLLEYRGDRIALQYSPEQPFSLPKNLFLIGTMNTADRSIALVDAAIRRRFPFIEMHPSEEPVSGVLAAYLDSVGGSPERADLLAELNGQLTGKLREFQIGPSYLMREEAATEEGLSRIWRYDILPLLEEQLYGTHDREQVHANFGLEAIRRAVARKKGQAQPAPDVDDEPEA